MANPDIRIRLSAEGVQEVVTALRKVQAEADKTGKGTAAGVGLANKALGEMTGLFKSLFPIVGITGAVLGLVNLAKNAFRSADAMEKLSQKTGLAVETLSILSSTAKKVDVDPERLEKGLIKFAKARDELVGGNKDMEEAFRRGVAVHVDHLDELALAERVAERLDVRRVHGDGREPPDRRGIQPRRNRRRHPPRNRRQLLLQIRRRRAARSALRRQ